MSSYHFNAPLFPYHIRIKFFSKKPRGLGNGDAMCRWEKSKSRITIFLNKNSWNWSLAAHECVHASNFLFRDAGHLLDLKNDETQAYAMSHFMEMIKVSWKAEKKKIKKKKKK